MIADPLSDSVLKSRIDTPNFSEVLAADDDGSFYADVTAYLDAWKAKIKGYQDQGVSSAEFSDLTRLFQSLQTAGPVLEFFVKLQKLPAAQPNEN